MKKKDYKNSVDNKEELLIVIDSRNNIIFQTKESPLSSFLKKVFIEEIKDKNLSIYANQIGIGLAELGKVLDIKYYYGTIISEPAKFLLKEQKVEFEYVDTIELVHSSSNSKKVCPIEEKLDSLKTFNERIEFLRERASQKNKSCYINFDKK